MPLSHVKNARCCAEAFALFVRCIFLSISSSSPPPVVQLERNHDKLMQEQIESRRQVTEFAVSHGAHRGHRVSVSLNATLVGSPLPAAASLKPFAL
jgi:hypothetical protein